MRLILAIFGVTFIFAENDVQIISESRTEMLREYRFGQFSTARFVVELGCPGHRVYEIKNRVT